MLMHIMDTQIDQDNDMNRRVDSVNFVTFDGISVDSQAFNQLIE